MQIKELTNQEFNEFISKYNIKSIYQTPEYGFTMNDEGMDTIFLGLIDNENIIAASLILIEKNRNYKYAYAPKGFLIDYNNYELLETFTSQIKKYLGKLNIAAIKINPMIIKNEYDNKYKVSNPNPYYENIFNNLKKLGYRHLGYNNYFEGLKPRFEAILDLKSPYYILFKNIKKEFRTKIRGAEKLGIKVYKGNSNDLELLYKQTRNKYPRDLQYFKNIYKFFKSNSEIYYAKLDTVKYLKLASKNLTIQEEKCNKLNEILKTNRNILSEKMSNDILLNKCKNNLINATKLITEFPDGIMLSSILIVKYNNTVYSLMDGYNPKFKRFNSKHLLIWKLIEKYSNLNFDSFNLGGIINPTIDDKKYDGLNEFKLSFNSKATEYIGDLELITNKPLYLLFKNSINKK